MIFNFFLFDVEWIIDNNLIFFYVPLEMNCPKGLTLPTTGITSSLYSHLRSTSRRRRHIRKKYYMASCEFTLNRSVFNYL